MNDLAELERALDADLRRALNAVMPTLENPEIASADDGDRHHTAERATAVDAIDIAQADQSRRPPWLLTSAAAAVALLVGGLAMLGTRNDQTANTDTPAQSLPGTTDDVPSTQAPAITVDGAFPLDRLGPYEAAAMISLDVRIGPTPDERADLEAAGAILTRECLRAGGATPPNVTAAEHQAFRDSVDVSLTAQTDFFTTAGIEFQRTNGYFGSDRFNADAAAPLHLEIQEGSLEERLMLDGCGGAGDALRTGPAERELRESAIEAVDSRWYPPSLSPQALPEYADGYRPYDDCLSAAGYPNHDDANADNSPFTEFLLDPELSAEELAFANADADCRISTDLPTSYVEALVPVLDEFEQIYETEIAAVRAERGVALASARVTLNENGIEPFTR